MLLACQYLALRGGGGGGGGDALALELRELLFGESAGGPDTGDASDDCSVRGEPVGEGVRDGESSPCTLVLLLDRPQPRCLPSFMRLRSARRRLRTSSCACWRRQHQQPSAHMQRNSRMHPAVAPTVMPATISPDNVRVRG